MNQLHVYFTEAQLAALKKLSERSGAPVSELVRRAVDAYIKKQVRV
jgi:hypothetical protein